MAGGSWQAVMLCGCSSLLPSKYCNDISHVLDLADDYVVSLHEPWSIFRLAAHSIAKDGLEVRSIAFEKRAMVLAAPGVSFPKKRRPWPPLIECKGLLH